MKDHVLRPDELPVIWRMNQQEQQTFIRFARKLDRRTVQIAGVTVYLAPISKDFSPTFDATDSPVCGMAELTETILRRLAKEQQ